MFKMVTEHDFRKMEVEEFKSKVLNYFDKDGHDVTLSEIFEGLKLGVGDLNLLQYCLKLLVEEGKLIESESLDHLEYDLEWGEGN